MIIVQLIQSGAPVQIMSVWKRVWIWLNPETIGATKNQKFTKTRERVWIWLSARADIVSLERVDTDWPTPWSNRYSFLICLHYLYCICRFLKWKLCDWSSFYGLQWFCAFSFCINGVSLFCKVYIICSCIKIEIRRRGGDLSIFIFIFIYLLVRQVRN